MMQWKWIGVTAGILVIGASVPLFLGERGTDAIRVTQAAPILVPRAVADSRRHNFGTMDVGQEGEHWFIIRNEGTGPLTLRQGSTSCSCTLSDLEGDHVPPDGQARVRLRWKPPKAVDLFAQGATIHTNDPEQKSLYFSVVGDVRVHLAATPDSVVFSNVSVGEGSTARFVVYSQVWDAFEIDVESPHPQLSVETQPADKEALSPLEARYGYVVRLTLAPGLKPGLFHTELKLAATPAAAEAAASSRDLSVQVAGQVSPNVWLEGPNLVESNVLDLGTITRGVGKKRGMALFVRGEGAAANVTSVHLRPEALKVRVGDREQVSEKLARYQIDVEVPPEAPAMACVGGLAGEIRLTTDHPEAPELRLKVDFAVLDPR
jgi:hypothetical protein